METPLSLLVFFVIFPLLFAVFVVFSLKRRRRQQESLLKRGIGYVKLLRHLLTYIQQHRGLTTGYINGNHLAKPDIDRLNHQVKTAITQLDTQRDWLVDSGKWRSLVDHWQRLAQSYVRTDADNNFKQHNILIANVLYLIEDVADAHHLAKMGGGNTDTDWRYLLSIAEYIGQARALGTGVAAKGECSSVMRIQLNHLRNKIAASVEQAWSDKLRQEIKQLLQCIETQLVIDAPSIAPSDYFSLATRCIDHILEQFDRQIDSLQFHRRH